MTNKNKKLKRTKNTLKVLVGTSIIASSLLSGQVFASTTSTTNSLIEKNHFGGDANVQAQQIPQIKNVLNIVGKKQVKTEVPLLQSVSPAMGETTVSPNQNVVFQLDPNAKEYKRASHLLAKGMVGAYLSDGNTLTPLAKSQVQFDSTTGKVTVQHALLHRYTQYAIVLDVQPHGLFNDIQQKLSKQGELAKSFAQFNNQPAMDVVTSVDNTSDTITLLGHGKVSLATENKVLPFVKGVAEKNKDHKSITNLKVGDVVTAIKNPLDGKTHIVGRDMTAISTFFTTGSAIGEATHVSAQVESASVRVTDGGKLDVTVTDDYGNPATHATLNVTGTGAGNARVASAFATPDAITITNGTAIVPLVDHSAEAVTLSYTSQDNTYKDAVDTQKGSANEMFLPGLTGNIQVNNPQKIVVGENADFTGVASDIYGNPVKDGTQMNVSAQAGTVSNVKTTINGDFSFSLQAPTKSGADSLSVAGADSGYSTNDSIMVEPGQLAQIVVTTLPSVKAGGTITVSGVGEDKYGNIVADGTQIKVTSQRGTVSNVTPTANGNFTFTFQVPTKLNQATGVTESIPVTLTSASGDVTQTIQVAVNPDVAKQVTLNPVTNAKAGTPIQITGTVVDQYANNVADGTLVSIKNGSTVISNATTTQGKYSANYTPSTSGNLSLSASVGSINTPSQSISVVASTPTTLTPPQNTQWWTYWWPLGEAYNPLYHVHGWTLPKPSPLGNLDFDLFQVAKANGQTMTGRGFIKVFDSYNHNLYYTIPVPDKEYQHISISKNDLKKAGLFNIDIISFVQESWEQSQVGIANIQISN
ncbi:hypothetical protein PP175_25260 (plasmid) [Aneurinibacillus sp. Ricciae_BoGa-3]|uniref:hypothetical protein n=1 Tax=Aneurinibacillus sp. Ricciae_BoGa-3 TaxID=3022697 RepID=UPI00233F8279|nr:hypothetical protein [Aneurinibacillus sp. Ricciae_BoGa-3]WCK57378.1 hypothetical protein PP175_25260 [Aneurinibacillus sp. Ricciae_BoGa-3]